MTILEKGCNRLKKDGMVGVVVVKNRGFGQRTFLASFVISQVL